MKDREEEKNEVRGGGKEKKEEEREEWRGEKTLVVDTEKGNSFAGDSMLVLKITKKYISKEENAK